MKRLIETVKKRHETITPKEYLALTDEEKRDVVSVKISPPRLGGSGFGKIVIERKKSIYKPVFDHAE